jgi:hypothetical protein
MHMMCKRLRGLALLAGMAFFVMAWRAQGEDYLHWRGREKKVDADIQAADLSEVLKQIARMTGWNVYLDPGASNVIAAKFKDLSENDALRLLLGNLNFARDRLNGVTRLFVYRTAKGEATRLIKEKRDYRIANEALIKLKNGADTNAFHQLAKKLGANIVGQNDRLGLYRLEFPDAASAAAGLQSLESNPAVAAAENNYVVDPPGPVQMGPAAASTTGPLFNLNPQPAVNGPIVGMVDTDLNVPPEFQKYMLTPINEAGQTGVPEDAPSHGTVMMETMLAAMSANPSMIQPVIVYGDNDSTTMYELTEGLYKAINAGANPINVSSGGTGDSIILGSLIAQAGAQGIQIVAASGNTGGTADTYPAAYPGVLAVTASAPNGQLASYADDGSFVQVMAPGTVVVPWYGQTWMVEGTSPATADVTGTLAELQNSQHLTLPQAVNQVMKTMPPPK